MEGRLFSQPNDLIGCVKATPQIDAGYAFQKGS